MNIIDYLALGILLGSALLGLMRGLSREALSLAAWVLAFLGARTYGADIAGLLPFPDSPELRHLAGLALTFLVILLLASLLAQAVAGAMKAAGLGALDRTLGMAFGLARGVAAVLALTLLAGLTAAPQTDVWRTALSRDWLESAAARALPWLPLEVSGLIKFS